MARFCHQKKLKIRKIFIFSPSFSNFENCSRNLDMQELDYNPSKKDLTDAKIHHLLAEELKPYKRVSLQGRSMIVQLLIDENRFPSAAIVPLDQILFFLSSFSPPLNSMKILKKVFVCLFFPNFFLFQNNIYTDCTDHNAKQ